MVEVADDSQDARAQAANGWTSGPIADDPPTKQFEANSSATRAPLGALVDRAFQSSEDLVNTVMQAIEGGSAPAQQASPAQQGSMNVVPIAAAWQAAVQAASMNGSSPLTQDGVQPPLGSVRRPLNRQAVQKLLGPLSSLAWPRFVGLAHLLAILQQPKMVLVVVVALFVQLMGTVFWIRGGSSTTDEKTKSSSASAASEAPPFDAGRKHRLARRTKAPLQEEVQDAPRWNDAEVTARESAEEDSADELEGPFLPETGAETTNVDDPSWIQNGPNDDPDGWDDEDSLSKRDSRVARRPEDRTKSTGPRTRSGASLNGIIDESSSEAGGAP